jgi:hypothetical protein
VPDVTQRVPLGFRALTLKRGARGKAVAGPAVADFQPDKLIVGLVPVRRGWLAGLVARILWLIFERTRDEAAVVHGVLVGERKILDVTGPIWAGILSATSVDCGIEYGAIYRGDVVTVDVENTGNCDVTVFVVMIGREAEARRPVEEAA